MVSAQIYVKPYWAKVYGGNGNQFIYSVEKTNDGGFILAGETQVNSGPDTDFLIIKLDAEGGVQWQKRYGGSDIDIAYSATQTSDGGYIVAGSSQTTPATKEDGLIIKLNSLGDIEWQKYCGTSGTDRLYSIKEIPNNDGGYVIENLLQTPADNQAAISNTEAFKNQVDNFVINNERRIELLAFSDALIQSLQE